MLHCENTAPPRQNPDIRWLVTSASDAGAIDAPRSLLVGFGLATAVSLALAVEAGLPLWGVVVLGATALAAGVFDWRRHTGGRGRQAVASVGIPAPAEAGRGRDGPRIWALRFGDGREARVALDSVYLAHPACVCVRFTEMDDDNPMNDQAGQAPRGPQRLLQRLLQRGWKRAPSRVEFMFAGRFARPEHRALRCAVRGMNS